MFQCPQSPTGTIYLLIILFPQVGDKEIFVSEEEVGGSNEVCDHKKLGAKAGALHKSKVEANGQLSLSAAGVHELQLLNNSVTVTAATPT